MSLYCGSGIGFSLWCGSGSCDEIPVVYLPYLNRRTWAGSFVCLYVVFFFCTSVTNIGTSQIGSESGSMIFKWRSGSDKMMRIQANPDPQYRTSIFSHVLRDNRSVPDSKKFVEAWRDHSSCDPSICWRYYYLTQILASLVGRCKRKRGWNKFFLLVFCKDFVQMWC